MKWKEIMKKKKKKKTYLFVATENITFEGEKKRSSTGMKYFDVLI